MKYASILAGLIFTSAPLILHAQFQSGSNEEDGELLITANDTLVIQDDGVHNYTSITIQNGATLTLLPNTKNTPVIFLASGDVTIEGTLNLSGENGLSTDHPNAGMAGSEAQGTAGGYYGGRGGVAIINGGTNIATPGGGPGGGLASLNPSSFSSTGRAGTGGSHALPGGIPASNPVDPPPTYGDSRLLTLTGGSGGAGGNINVTNPTTREGAGGGAGGGAICIASSGTITVDGTIDASGGSGTSSGGFDGGGVRGSGGGAGGAVRLMANTIAGNGSVLANGGVGGFGSNATGGAGYVRFESFNISGNLPNNSNPSPSSAAPTIVSFPPDLIPTISVASIAGVPVPVDAGGRITMPDLIIPDTESNPVQIVLQTENVPDGAIITCRITQENGETLVVDSTPVASDSATASVDLDSGIGGIYTTADFNPER